MSDSKSGSKSDLNESNMPLLDEETEKAGETPEKEQIELTGEKDDSKEQEKKDKKKKKKEKEKKPKGPGCIETLSEGLNCKDRDDKGINTEIDLGFDDVLAEPNSAQGFDGVWRLAFIVFTQAKLWLYRLLSAVIAIPAALVWAVVFAFVTVVYVWILAPSLRLFEFGFYLFRRVFGGFIRCWLEPICTSLGAIFSKVSVSQRRHITQEA